MRKNLGVVVGEAVDDWCSRRDTMLVGVSPLSKPAKEKLLDSLTRVRDGYKLLLVKCK